MRCLIQQLAVFISLNGTCMCYCTTQAAQQGLVVSASLYLLAATAVTPNRSTFLCTRRTFGEQTATVSADGGNAACQQRNEWGRVCDRGVAWTGCPADWVHPSLYSEAVC